MSSDRSKRLSREQSQAQTRARLLAAARGLFVAQGFGAASIRDIAEAAGYSQGGFYSNFASKEALLLVLLQQHMEAEAEQLTAVLAADDASATAVLARLEQWAQTLNADADWSMLAIELQLHANRSPPFAHDYWVVCDAHRRRLGQLIAQLFASLQRDPPIPVDDLADGFMALAHGLAIGRKAGSHDPSGTVMMAFLRAMLGLEPV